MKFHQAATLLLTAASGTLSVEGQHIRSRKTAESVENDAPFWSRELLDALGSMVEPTPTAAPSPGTEDPTSAPTIDRIVNSINNDGLVFNEILNIKSYTTFCEEGEYTKVMIEGMDKSVFCVTNFDGAEVGFGFEQDYPDRPIIKLNIDPPSECAIGEITDEFKNFCGFSGIPHFIAMSHQVIDLSHDGDITGRIGDVASYTTYCVEEEYTNVEMVDFNGDIYCLTTDSGIASLTYSEDASIDLEPPLTCEGDRNTTNSFPCGFEGVEETVYPNFDLSSNITIL